ncbi:hypothetical protein [Nocardioides sp. cx-173]|uniref:hypothetical protein n=1 Tax=Nocardioides sp. cx-173 TaxID=2898796 RepID=UPI001E5E2AE2|nr:hypothetical protein [Nocardioides sp. cx-173]MCD4526742.1 hypothetical protein [Nocardioides sp. cx-173]UGB42516.1 hypothetical protein LQ940_03085 [Nocardioides sp. cx-173]
MKILLSVLTTILLTLGVAGLARADHGSPVDRVPEPPVIVEVEGDAANGFGIHYSDGSELSPPTDSEAFAECGEYDRRVARVRCRTEVRVWYRDLGDLKRALEHARS